VLECVRAGAAKFMSSHAPAANTDHAHEADSPKTPARVGVILADLDKLNVTALKYLVVHLNTLQNSVEFEFLAVSSDDPLLALLSAGMLVDREKCESMLSPFHERIVCQFKQEQVEYDLADRSLPNNFAVISLAKFSDGHYGLKSGPMQVQALGNWERSMAPPSILEFIIVLLMRQAASFVVPSLGRSFHLGTKGCLFDFTADLGEARYKALQSFVCSVCRQQMKESGHPDLADDLVHVLDLNWLGVPTDPHCLAGIVAKLGYNLFLTKGIEPTLWENLRSILRDEATKEFVKLLFAVLLAALLFRLGLKGGE
jgi:hypothetical protein